MSNKKVLFIIWSFTYGGGAERILANIVNNLDHAIYNQIDYLTIGEKIYNSNSNFENISLTEYKSYEELINKYVNNSKEISLKFDNQI